MNLTNLLCWTLKIAGRWIVLFGDYFNGNKEILLICCVWKIENKCVHYFIIFCYFVISLFAEFENTIFQGVLHMPLVDTINSTDRFALVACCFIFHIFFCFYLSSDDWFRYSKAIPLCKVCKTTKQNNHKRKNT